MLADSGGEIGYATGDQVPGASPSSARLGWYVVYTIANHERRVADHIDASGLAFFLPTFKTTTQWKDRRVVLHRPLFPGYVFIRMAPAERVKVLKFPGVAWFVGMNGTPSAVPSEDIDALRQACQSGLPLSPCAFVEAGTIVRITRGPLSGFRGTVARMKGQSKLILSIGLIQRSVCVEVDFRCVEIVSN